MNQPTVKPTITSSLKKYIIGQRNDDAELLLQATKELATHHFAGIRAAAAMLKLESELTKAVRTNTEKELFERWEKEIGIEHPEEKPQ